MYVCYITYLLTVKGQQEKAIKNMNGQPKSD